ncbi:MAG: DUF1298 domain-containing protein [Actinobacteria bacterium]|nr:DUF1298 domain-containing protein [Actinomycetota bacterium]
MSTWGPGQWLTGWDASTWSLTTANPGFGSAVVGLFELEGQLQRSEVANALEALARGHDVLRERIQQTGLPLLPARTEILNECDVSNLLSFAEMDGPIKWRNLREIVQAQLRTPFDSQNPAWRAVMVTSTDQQSTSSYLVIALHHALADGVRAVSLADALMNPTQTKQRDDNQPSSARQDFPAALLDMASELGARAFTEGLSLVSQVMVDPKSARTRLSDLAVSALRSVNPFTRPLSTLFAPRSGHIRLDRVQVELAPLQAVARKNQVSLTAVMLNAIRLGMAAYHSSMGDSTQSIRVNVPVALPRQHGQRNALAVSRMQLELESSGDSALDLKLIHSQLAGLRTEPALQWANVAADLSRLLPTETSMPLLSNLVGGADITVSSIKGPNRGFVGSSAVVGVTAFAPVFGAAVSLNLMSQDDLVSVGICSDTGAVKHPKRLTRFCERGFAEMAALSA